MLNAAKKFFLRTDWILLGLCLAASVFGLIVIASATNLDGARDYVIKQVIALGMGLGLYVLISFVDLEILAEHQTIIIIGAALFLAMLYPFGIDDGTGNRSWIQVPVINYMIQPAEYCKIIYIVVVARISSVYQERINSLPCVLRLILISALFLGLIVGISKDARRGSDLCVHLYRYGSGRRLQFCLVCRRRCAAGGVRSDFVEQFFGSGLSEAAYSCGL